MCFFQAGIHIGGFSRDRNLIRESPGGPSRLGGWKGSSVNRHLLLRQFSDGCPRKNRLHEKVVFKNHLFAHSRCPELLESLRSEEHTSELQSHLNLVCRLLL